MNPIEQLIAAGGLFYAILITLIGSVIGLLIFGWSLPASLVSMTSLIAGVAFAAWLLWNAT